MLLITLKCQEKQSPVGRNWLDLNKDKYKCECCNFKTPHKSNYTIHLLRKKHIKNINGNEIKPITYNCILCKFKTLNKSNFIIHTKTPKHFKSLLLDVKYKKVVNQIKLLNGLFN